MIKQIKKAKFKDIEEKTVEIEFEDGTRAIHIADDVMREHTSSYLTYIESGGTVEAFETEEERRAREKKKP